MLKIITPTTKLQIEEYYKLRWSLLRRPWGGKRGSEIDELEEKSFHKAIIINNMIVGIGRIHFIDKLGQIRYMAVKNKFSRKGLGSKIILALEKIAVENNSKKIFLNSRENAIQFYEKNGYLKVKRVKSSFGSIVHYRMEKVLEKL